MTAGKLRTELMSLMSHHRVTYPTLKALQELGVATYTWEVYKRMESSKPNDLLEDRQRILGIKYDKCVFSKIKDCTCTWSGRAYMYVCMF